MKRRAGPAPGPDGITYRHLSNREVADCSRQLSRVVLNGSYVPGPNRPVRVPKTKGGHRTLRLSNLFDRVLASALNRAMEPIWESIFLPMSFGFRRGSGVWHFLATLESVMFRKNRWTLAIDDLRKAFDSLIIADVLRDHETYIRDTELLSLVTVVLQGGDGKKVRGIDQGCPYSPTALNVRLHHAYDLEAEQGHFPPRFRYADNLVAACRDVAEGQLFLDDSRHLLLRAGLELKGEDGQPANLAIGDTAQVLGFTLSKKNGRLVFNLGNQAWLKLEQNLVEAHQMKSPTVTAKQVVTGWINFAGLAFENVRDDSLKRVLDLAASHGFREIGSLGALRDVWENSWKHWNAFRKEMQISEPGEVGH